MHRMLEGQARSTRKQGKTMKLNLKLDAIYRHGSDAESKNVSQRRDRDGNASVPHSHSNLLMQLFP